MKHQGFEYEFDKESGNAAFFDQPWPSKPSVNMVGFVLEPNDTICFNHSVVWSWKNNKFTIVASSPPALFAHYNVELSTWILIK